MRRLAYAISLAFTAIWLVGGGSGCRLAPSRATEVHSKTTLLGVFENTTDMGSIKVTEKNVIAGDVKFKWRILGFEHEASAKDYVIPKNQLEQETK